LGHDRYLRGSGRVRCNRDEYCPDRRIAQCAAPHTVCAGGRDHPACRGIGQHATCPRQVAYKRQPTSTFTLTSWHTDAHERAQAPTPITPLGTQGPAVGARRIHRPDRLGCGRRDTCRRQRAGRRIRLVRLCTHGRGRVRPGHAFSRPAANHRLAARRPGRLRRRILGGTAPRRALALRLETCGYAPTNSACSAYSASRSAMNVSVV
jgi:hypothetical protein